MLRKVEVSKNHVAEKLLECSFKIFFEKKNNLRFFSVWEMGDFHAFVFDCFSSVGEGSVENFMGRYACIRLGCQSRHSE